MTYVPDVGAAGDRHVTMIPGDGIGPEVAAAVEEVVAELGAPIVWDRFPDVKGATRDGSPVAELDPAVLASIRRNGACFKGTLFTPLSRTNTSTQSLNVALRKALDLHVNLVHGFAAPGVPSRWADKALDIVVIRENVEGELRERERKTALTFWEGLLLSRAHTTSKPLSTLPTLPTLTHSLSLSLSLSQASTPAWSTRSRRPTSWNPSRLLQKKNPSARASTRLGLRLQTGARK
jgi:hypothetical protein